MSSLHSSPSNVSSASVTSHIPSTSVASPSASSTAPLPSGCASASFTGYGSGVLSGGYFGCTTSLLPALDACCATVGSTPGFANSTCGCPYNFGSFQPNTSAVFQDCVGHMNASSICATAEVSAASSSLGGVGRWKVAGLVLGMGLLSSGYLG
ncbi:unnamed protein product [Mycena citricolor]|uniref:Uncharacterized protein n=1 Tax=Mycena citricolor TaxID=2018698 RepID=A0AAD2GZQ0_9AGAR|nr:unnamed protein product [Mycena citricolor]